MLANAIRALSMDAVQAANSGHPGMPMGMADIAVVLWTEFLVHHPENPEWMNRDRFILSNGHGSMLLYSLLHLSGYALSIEDLKQFRQLHSKTPGHPELGYTPGVETTTGPLGQGLANAVGMALAEKVLAAQFNMPGHSIIQHYTYVFLGDGCLMEGISHEAASLAGTWQLNKLIAFWDDNGISIDGEVEGWFTDNTPKRFEAYGWNVIAGVDGHDPAAIRAAIKKARAHTHAPTLICCKTKIGFGSPNKAGKESCHGAALGAEEVALTRAQLGWNHPPFEIPAEIYAAFDAREKGAAAEAAWNKAFALYTHDFPEKAAELLRRKIGVLPQALEATLAEAVQKYNHQLPNIATRKASQETLNSLGPICPEFLGGSADLAGSNLTLWKGATPITQTQFAGNYLYYGVREFSMSAIANGIALYRGFIPYVATFLVFTDYARSAIRMSAIMKQRVIYVMTHDSIGLGEDGPTHQPVEHISALRLIPNLSVWRPADATETLIAWQEALKQNNGPSLLALSRQNLPTQVRDDAQLKAIPQGGYVLVAEPRATFSLVATGSEVHLALGVQKQLAEEGLFAQVISMPCLERFLAVPENQRDEVLKGLPMFVIEAGSTALWYQLIKGKGQVFGLDRFGESAKAEDLFSFFGFTLEKLAPCVREWASSI
jgi:transketolase